MTEMAEKTDRGQNIAATTLKQKFDWNDKNFICYSLWKLPTFGNE